jgi:MFS family permease
MLAVLLLGQFMGLVDLLIVNVAVPAIGAGLHTSGAILQLIIAGYTIAYAMLLITGARLGAVLGRRRMYLTGVALFTLASLGCGLAPTGLVLIGWRFLQGAGAALMVPQIISVIQTRFEGQERARALSAYGVVLAIGAVAGLLLGGVIVQANLLGLTWRPAFLVNLPLGLLLLIAVPKVMPADPPRGRVSIDFAGLITATLSVLLIVLPLTLGREFGWPLWAFLAIAAGLLLGGVFLVIERRAAAPLLNLAVLRSPGLRAGLSTLVFLQVANGGFLFVFTLYLQRTLGYDPLRAGLTYLPMIAPFGLVGYFWRRIPARLQRFVVPVGMILCVAGYLSTSLILIGVGLGLAVSPTLTQSLLRVAPEHAADASGLLTTIIQLGAVIGVATVGTVYLATNALPSVWLAASAAAALLCCTMLVRALGR